MADYELIFDIETQNTFSDVHSNLKNIRLAVVCAYHTGTGEYRHFTEDTLAEFWPLFEGARRVVGFNSISFDVPVLHNYYHGDLLQLPHLDILQVIKDSLGKRLKLDDVAHATLKQRKSSDGLTAIRWWQEGQVEKVIEYCRDDVRLTKELYEFGLKHRQLFYQTLTGAIQPFPVNFEFVPPKAQARASSVQQGFNLSLPL